jgi:HAD superfamily hydrolase (TIGR01509 family)
MHALIFDLDGTLVNSVYAHIFAWQQALDEAGMAIDGWRIHRRIGMSGGLFARAVGRELGFELTEEQQKSLKKRHGELYLEYLPNPRPLPGAVELLKYCRSKKIPHAIATSGEREDIQAALKSLAVGQETLVVTHAEVERAKPEPDLFLYCQKKLGMKLEDCYVIGDAVWDILAARRANMLSVGLLSGGYGADELSQAGAFRVYRDTEELRFSLDELGVLP